MSPCTGVRRDGSACTAPSAPHCLYCYHHYVLAEDVERTRVFRFVGRTRCKIKRAQIPNDCVSILYDRGVRFSNSLNEWRKGARFQAVQEAA